MLHKVTKPLSREPGSVRATLGTKMKAGACYVRQRWYLEIAGVAVMSWVAGMQATADLDMFVARLVPAFLAGIYLSAARIGHPFRWGFALLLLPLVLPFLPTVIPFAFDIGIIVASGQGGEVYVNPADWERAATVSFGRTAVWLPIVMLGIWVGDMVTAKS